MPDPRQALAAAAAAQFDPERDPHPWVCVEHFTEPIGCPKDSPGWREQHAMIRAIREHRANMWDEPLRPTPPFGEWIAAELAKCRPGTEREIAERRAAHEAAKPHVEALVALVEGARDRVAARQTETPADTVSADTKRETR